MTRIDHPASEEMPLSEAIQRRKQHYVNKVKMTLDCLYGEDNYSQAELYETALSDLSSKAIAGRLGRTPEKGDPRPRLDYETYVEARKHRMSDEEIKIWFKTSWREFSGFVGAYSRFG